MSMFLRQGLLFVLVITLSLLAFLGIATTLATKELPELYALTHYQPKQPLRIYSEDGFLMAEFGEERRTYLPINAIPELMQKAVIAIEDRRFYQHHGIDYRGIARALLANLTGTREGASTITMQVAKNFFSQKKERGLATKFYETLLALKIEKELRKEKILELYLNQIYLGQRSYGFPAAADVYFGRPLKQLNIAELAMLAGLPKAPTAYNPFVNYKRALNRQREVLHDMLQAGFIQESLYKTALAQPLRFRASRQQHQVAADYVSEMVRAHLYGQYQDSIYSSGLKVYTTILKANQEAAATAVRDGVLDYGMRHGYRGAENLFSLNSSDNDNRRQLDDLLNDIDIVNGLVPAIVTRVNATTLTVHNKFGSDLELTGNALGPLQNLFKDKKVVNQTILKPGALVRVQRLNNNSWQLNQLPEVEAALVAMDANNGAIRALVGGFDFNRNKFNHVTQAWRQPGSSFKPFLYSAALEKGFTAASIVLDEPLSFSAGGIGRSWEPQNYDHIFRGPVRLRYALAKSINIVAIRVLQSMGVDYAQDYISRFGFTPEKHPPYLTMALGAGSATAWQLVGAYAVFANGGYRVHPSLINKVVDQNGKVIFQSNQDNTENGAARVIDVRNAFVMNSMLQDVVRYGTALSAQKLGRDDIAGKTGTTNNNVDAWFTGYHPKHVAVAWIGFDQPRSLGRNETGGVAALPIWNQYMATALKTLAPTYIPVPEGISVVRVNAVTGAPDVNGLEDYIYSDQATKESVTPDNLPPTDGENDALEQLLHTDLLKESEI